MKWNKRIKYLIMDLGIGKRERRGRREIYRRNNRRMRMMEIIETMGMRDIYGIRKMMVVRNYRGCFDILMIL
ncbi:MAG: hypothetical protein QXU32_02170 [Nitrososphaerales archaeon]